MILGLCPNATIKCLQGKVITYVYISSTYILEELWNTMEYCGILGAPMAAYLHARMLEARGGQPSVSSTDLAEEATMVAAGLGPGIQREVKEWKLKADQWLSQ